MGLFLEGERREKLDEFFGMREMCSGGKKRYIHIDILQ